MDDPLLANPNGSTAHVAYRYVHKCAHQSSRADLVANEEALYISPDGLTMATGVVIKAYTDMDGTTDSTYTDCPAGFVIIGQ